ncbi:MAG: UDP-N-acetylmuramate dehydrogenase [Eubacteriales bacterium]|nr:UDP-N-acetylmuramate dehydrogenase [Eubacteriales bacterium]
MIQRLLQEEIRRILPPAQVRFDEPMRRHCSFRTGGPADALVYVRTGAELAALLSLLHREGEDYFVLGRGTNLLIGDGGYRGVIITAAHPVGMAGTDESVGINGLVGMNRATGMDGTDRNAENSGVFSLEEIRVQEEYGIRAGAGATLHAVAMTAMEHGLSGLEFAAGIPGTVGGGLVMNAGAYGGEMKQVVSSVCGMMPDGEIRTWTGKEMEFSYRFSILHRMPAIALMADFSLHPDDPERIRARMADLAAQRRAKQPLEYPSAGSTFKRPKGLFAGKLIMDAGLRGMRVGDAQVSEKHCGFVINRGGATSAQIRELIDRVQEMVYEDAGVRLEREVIYLGEF